MDEFLDKNNKKYKKNIGIWGYGIVGRSILQYLLKRLASSSFTVIANQKFSKPDIIFFNQHNIKFLTESKQNIAEFIGNNKKIFVSPGIDVSQYINQNKTHLIQKQFFCELDLFCSEWNKPLIVITGTLGKTSITSLLSDLLKLAGKNIKTGGNIGLGMLDLINNQAKTPENSPIDYGILELSSYQLELVDFNTKFQPALAIWTNFYPNHLDRHKTIDNYFEAKLNIFLYQNLSQKAVLNWEFRQNIYKLNLARIITWFSTDILSAELEYHFLIRPQDIVFRLDINNNIVYKYTEQGISEEIINLPDFSYPVNWLILYIVGKILNINLAQFFNVQNNNLLSVPDHRLEYICKYNNFIFYNDSKSTVPESTLTAIQYIAKKYKQYTVFTINLFIGGTSKGINRKIFIQQLKLFQELNQNIKIVLFCFGLEDAKSLNKWALEENLVSYYHENLENSFYYLTQLLELNKNSKDKNNLEITLLSPAGASFDLFQNYKSRGNKFCELVYQYTNPQNPIHDDIKINIV